MKNLALNFQVFYKVKHFLLTIIYKTAQNVLKIALCIDYGRINKQ